MAKILQFFKKIYRFARYDVWRITESELSRGKRIFYRLIKIIVLSVRGFFNDELNLKASALTYFILFAIVPIFAIVLAVAKGFGFETAVEYWLNNSFLNNTEIIPVIMGFVERYLETAQGGLFLGIGILILLWSVTIFFMQVEMSFNAIWQVRKSRSLVRQFTAYLSILLLIPIMVVVSAGLSIFINSRLPDLQAIRLISPVVTFLIKLAPYAIMWVMFTLMYLIIPNVKVRFWSAATAGFITGSAFYLLQMLYIWGQVYLTRYNVVYGSFAAIPLLLLWLQISCLIILFGAELSYVAQNVRNFDYEVDTKTINRRYRDYVALYLTYRVVKRFECAQEPYSAEQLALENHLPIRLVNQLLAELVEGRVLIEAYTDGSQAKTYMPAMDINALTVEKVLRTIDMQGTECFLQSPTEQMKEFWGNFLKVKAYVKEDYADILVKDLILEKNPQILLTEETN